MKEAFLINKSGKMVSDVYDYIGMWDSKGQLLTPVKQGEGWGFMNHDGIVKVPFIYENCTRSRSVLVNSLDLNYCWVKKDGKYGFQKMSKWLLHASIYLPEVLALDWLLLLKMAISGFI